MEPWKQLTEQSVYDGYRKIVRRKYALPQHVEADFDIIVSPRAVCILALTEDRKVILVKQFRPGPGHILLELPGGGVDEGENPGDAAARELLEETGYQGTLTFISTNWHDAYNTLRRYNFVATDCKKVQEPKQDPTEPIEVQLMELQAFRKHLQNGELTDTATGYLGLEFLKLL